MSKKVVTKSCTSCNKTKPESDFGIVKRNIDGRNKKCKECVRTYFAQRRANAKITATSTTEEKISIIKRDINNNKDDDELGIELCKKLEEYYKNSMTEKKSTVDNSIRVPKTRWQIDKNMPCAMLIGQACKELAAVGIIPPIDHDSISYVEYDSDYLFVFDGIIISEQHRNALKIQFS